jgi:hypothetical protein
MGDDVRELIDRLREIEDALESQIEARRKEFGYELRKRKAVFEKSVVAQHREIKTGILRFLKHSPILSILTAPFIYGLIFPMALLDLSVCLFQVICFPVWGMSPVRRSEYLVIDRQYLAFLNGIQKLNCVSCGYANGLVAFIQEVASRTEQYWCPIKHARRVEGAHKRYRHFVDYGDAESFQKGLDDFRQKLRKCKQCQARKG